MTKKKCFVNCEYCEHYREEGFTESEPAYCAKGESLYPEICWDYTRFRLKDNYLFDENIKLFNIQNINQLIDLLNKLAFNETYWRETVIQLIHEEKEEIND